MGYGNRKASEGHQWTHLFNVGKEALKTLSLLTDARFGGINNKYKR